MNELAQEIMDIITRSEVYDGSEEEHDLSADVIWECENLWDTVLLRITQRFYKHIQVPLHCLLADRCPLQDTYQYASLLP